MAVCRNCLLEDLPAMLHPSFIKIVLPVNDEGALPSLHVIPHPHKFRGKCTGWKNKRRLIFARIVDVLYSVPRFSQNTLWIHGTLHLSKK